MVRISWYLASALFAIVSTSTLAQTAPPADSVGNELELTSFKFGISGTTDLTSDLCGHSSTFAVPPGTEIHFCFDIYNDGTDTLAFHDLDDDLGVILDNFDYALEPDRVMLVTKTREPLDGGYSATWAATAQDSTEVVAATSQVQISALPPVLACNGPTSTFSNGIPVGWSSYDALALALAPDSEVDWRTLDGCREGANYTGGSGGAACASSDPVDPQPYDAQLRSHRFSLEGRTDATLELLLNYQDHASADLLDVEIQRGLDGAWETLTSANSSLGEFRDAPGAALRLDLADYLGEPGLKIRIRYHNESPSASDWYVQVDNIRLVCDGGLFFDGFESGDADAWHYAVADV